MTLTELIRRLEAIDVEAVCIKVLEGTASEYESLNREQLMEGFNKKSERLKPYRSREYARMKHAMNPRPGQGNPDLRLTGAFMRSFLMQVKPPNIVVHVNDRHMLIEKYGSDILGLSRESRAEYINKSLRPYLQLLLYEAIGF